MHSGETLDPSDWTAFRKQAHAMLEDILDYTQNLRQRPVWRPIPGAVKERFREKLPRHGSALSGLHQRFLTEIMPYSIGNSHPGFMGWVQGGGTPVGMVADMLAAGLNANVGGREQIPVAVEQQIEDWMRELFHFPASAHGLFVTGTSLANLIAVLIARTKHLGKQVRQQGLDQVTQKLTAYTSSGAHGCVSQAMDLAGLGTSALRQIPVNARFELDTQKLMECIRADKAAGYTPFLIVGSAGTVDVGAIDDLTMLADIAQAEQCWFHIDGAYGALGMFSTQLAPKLIGIERADSIAFDFHKWGQVPYDAGYILVRDAADQLATFAAPANYLKRETRGMAAGSPWPCDFGPDLSRGFKALKTWFTIAGFGADKLGQIIDNTCDLAQYLKQQIAQQAALELMAPVNLNIVCFRYIGKSDFSREQSNAFNAELVIALQESGLVAPSSTTIDNYIVIRAAFVNHRTARTDVDQLMKATLRLGQELLLSQQHG